MTPRTETRREHDAVGAYVLGVLDEADADRFEAHLAGCDRCAAELDELDGPGTAARRARASCRPGHPGGRSRPAARPGPAAGPADRRGRRHPAGQAQAPALPGRGGGRADHRRPVAAVALTSGRRRRRRTQPLRERRPRTQYSTGREGQRHRPGHQGHRDGLPGAEGLGHQRRPGARQRQGPAEVRPGRRRQGRRARRPSPPGRCRTGATASRTARTKWNEEPAVRRTAARPTTATTSTISRSAPWTASSWSDVNSLSPRATRPCGRHLSRCRRATQVRDVPFAYG